MDVDSIRKYCLSFSSATENLQWGDDLCFKIGGKIFVTLGLESVPQRMCFKCTPEKFDELCELENIEPAPYVGRYKWVMVTGLNVLPDEELRDLIRQSYEMAAKKAGRKGKRVRTGKARNRRAKRASKRKRE